MPLRMSVTSQHPVVCLGFLSVIENADLGFLGGYLLLNPAGRPLEFHCTAPVRPNRTQEILYGAALRPFLYGELIGQTLLAKSRHTPLVVCTDSPAALAARDTSQIPLVLVQAVDAASTSPQPSAPNLFRLGQSLVLTAPRFENDRQVICQAWPSQAEQLDLLEPFERIREALMEAQAAAKQAA